MVFQTILVYFYVVFRQKLTKNKLQGQKKTKEKTFKAKKILEDQKKLSGQKKTSQAKKMDFIYQKESNLDEENNFTIEI